MAAHPTEDGRGLTTRQLLWKGENSRLIGGAKVIAILGSYHRVSYLLCLFHYCWLWAFSSHTPAASSLLSDDVVHHDPPGMKYRTVKPESNDQLQWHNLTKKKKSSLSLAPPNPLILLENLSIGECLIFNVVMSWSLINRRFATYHLWSITCHFSGK
jgi:hypothetical protein